MHVSSDEVAARTSRHVQKPNPKCTASWTGSVAGPPTGPIETDGQVSFNEVSFEEAVVTLQGPAVVDQGRKSPRGGIYIER
jgi:hypothetical protein